MTTMIARPSRTLVDTAAAARELAHHLFNPNRTRPVVLVTRPRHPATGLIDLERVTDEIGGIADVYEMPTSNVSVAFADALWEFPGTQCYGGAGRVYPVGSEWAEKLWLSPLRLVYSTQEAERATEDLIQDACAAVFSAGHSTSTPSGISAGGTSHDSSDDLTSLKKEIERLTVENKGLRCDLEESRKQATSAIKAKESVDKRASADRSAHEMIEADAQAFAHDSEQQFRHDVYLAWTRRIPAADKARLALRSYTLGAEFLSSLDILTKDERAKAVQVTVEVLTGLVDALAGRMVHPLRRGKSGNAPVVRRTDGAVCWRAALQHKTPSARRLHYWRATDGSIELSSVRLHDDMRA